jgi:hypothetical protein
MVVELLLEPDDRGRISLAKVPGSTADRYIVRPLPGGSLLLQPAVVLSRQSVESLLKVVEARRDGPRRGRPLNEVLDRFGRPEISAERIAEIREHAAGRREQGFRSPADLSKGEVDALRAGSAGLDNRRP